MTLRAIGRLTVVLVWLAAISCSAGGGGAVDGGADIGVEIGPDAGDASPDALPTDGVEAADPGSDAVAPIEHAGVVAHEDAGVVSVANGALVVRVDLGSGLLRVEGADGTLFVEGAEARAILSKPVATVRSGALPVHTWAAGAFSDPLGDGLRLTVRHEGDQDPGLIQTLELRAGQTFLSAACEIRWAASTPAGVRVERLSPLVADETTGGALFVGPDPATHRVLDDGYDLYFDFDARVFPLGDFGSVIAPPGTLANWNAAVYDPASKRSVIAGFLSATRGGGLVGLDYDAAKAHQNDGRTGLTRLDGLTYYLHGRAPIADSAAGGAALTSELFYLDVAPPDVFTGLEAFAERYAARIGKVVWTDVPTGWNSWGGGGGSGGLGTNIDEPLMLANLDAAAADFAPWGMRYFLIDDGWEDHEGDWNSHPARFPDHDGVPGMKWLADRIRDKGLIPGLWISPFGVEPDAQLALDHPDWFADLWGPAIGLAGDKKILDLSRVEVLDWLGDLFTRITKDWGYKWIKVDFSYLALGAVNLHDPDVTPTEAYRNALMRMRQVIGPETFFLMVSAMGISMEMADGERITLDNEPWWGDPQKSGDQGIKVTYRTIARRYYLNHRLWVNHPDLLFYRDDYGLTLDEARAWTSAVALSGGIVKLGETYLELHEHPEWRAMVEPLLPVYPHTGRPLDLFAREYPETWDLPVTRGTEAWHVVGLFNWGLNKDIGAKDLEPESTRTVSLALADLGLDPTAEHLVFDAWAHTWSFVTAAEVSATLEPRTTRVLVVRPTPTEPRVVFSTRHLLGGAVDVHDEAWSAADGALTATLDTVAGVPTTVYVAAADRSPIDLDAPGAAELTYEAREGMVVVSFVPATARTALTLRFE